jgi:clan AA aspartic protease (TIGR02281 family)
MARSMGPCVEWILKGTAMKTRMVLHALLFGLGLLLMGVAARGDIVTMKDGRRFEGKIISENDDQVVIDTLVSGMRLNAFPLRRLDIAAVEHQALAPDFWGKKEGSGSTAAPKGVSGADVAVVPLPPGLLKNKGLVRGADAIVLADEASLLDSYKLLSVSRRSAERENIDRRTLEQKLAEKQKVIKNTKKQWDALDAVLPTIKDVGVYNSKVTQMNDLLSQHMQAVNSIKDLEEQRAKFTPAFKTKYVDGLQALTPKIDAAVATYAQLAADPTVKAALAHLSPPAPLGPSAEFLAAAADITKWQADVESEAIPLQGDNGTFMVDALLNGEHFMMVVDTGASDVSLSGEAAEKLGLHPSEKDPTAKYQIADGSIVEAKVMTLDTVRVGRFTVSNVTCSVLPKGRPNVPLLLGGSFLNHFIVKMEPSKKELRLTDVKDASASEH